MVSRLVALAAIAAAALALGPAAAHGYWQSTEIPFGAHDIASALPGETLHLLRTGEGTFATPYGAGLEPGARQQLDSGWNFYPTVDGSVAGGAVAVWYNEDAVEVRVAERPPTGGDFVPAAAAPGGRGDYGYGRPYLAVNERGDAIVAYLAELPGRLQQVRTLFRPAGGEFGPPEAVGAPAPWNSVYPRDVAVGPDGTAVVGLVRGARTHVAVRPPGGPWGAEEALGTATPDTWLRPQVGVDALGDVVVAYLQATPERDDFGTIQVAFKPRGKPFGAPRATGLAASDVGAIDVAVSAVGEVIVLVEAGTAHPDGGWHGEGAQAIMGNAVTGALGEPARLSEGWGDHPELAMNARGDAVVVYDECCPMAVRARRRLPLLGFGPVEDVMEPLEFEGVRGGIVAGLADVDELGNARMTYHDDDVDQPYLAQPLPLITEQPPEVPALGDLVAPVLAPLAGLPEVVPDLPGGGGLPGTPSRVPPPPVFAARATDRVADVAAPRLVLSPARVRSRPGRLMTRVGCSEACRVRLVGTYAGRRLRPLDLVLKEAGSKRIGLRVRRRAGRARIVATATDAAGNVATRRVSVRVR